jgi:enoyl-CoA hydratase
MPYQFLEIEVENYIATMSLARTKSLNALNLAFVTEMSDAIRELGAREDVRVIILKSNARIFCSGLDLKDISSLGLIGGGAKAAYFFKQKLQGFFDCCNLLESCNKPVIAAVHGSCVGGGLDIACACDIRLCTEDASFCLKEAAVGVVADMGVLQRLPHIVGQGYAREMAFTACNYSSEEAQRMGLVNAVYPDVETLLAAAKKLAAQIAENAPLAVMGTKEVLNYSRTASIEEGMNMAITKNSVLFSSKDLVEAFTAFAQNRKPDFKGE